MSQQILGYDDEAFVIDNHIARCCNRHYSRFVIICYVIEFPIINEINKIYAGVSLRPQHLSKDTILLISYPGELFLRMLKLMTLPLLISSIITVSSNLHAGVSGKMVFRALMYFVLTTILAILIGFTIALTFEPGTAEFNQTPDQLKNKKDGKFLDSLLDLGR